VSASSIDSQNSKLTSKTECRSPSKVTSRTTRTGSISVIVDDAVVVGAGVYQETYEQNRQLLAEDGPLDPETKQSLPELPAKIGIATGADSDARV
jgi:exonuclease VII large subunit